MRAFSAAATHTVTLHRGAETVTLTLTALPMGYSAWLERVYPQPTELINGVRVSLDAVARDWRYDQNLLCIAKALGSQVDATAPTSSRADEWAAYAQRLRAEFSAAGLNDGDYVALANGLAACHRGADGEPGNAS